MPDRRDPALAAELALVGIAAVWGLTFVTVQDAIRELPVTAFLAYRFTAAAAVMAIVFGRQLRALPRAGVRAGLVMGAFLTTGYLFQTLGLATTTASNAGFVTGLFVVLTPIFAAVFLRERTTRLVWAAAGVAAVGLLLLSGAGAAGAGSTGDLLVFVAACAFAFHILATERGVRRYSPEALLVVQLAVCGFVCLALGAAAGDLVAPTGATVWTALIVTSLVASALGYLVQSYAQRHAPPARTALILASEPAFAGLFAFLLNGERLSAVQWTGAALMMGAIVAVEIIRQLRPAAADPHVSEWATPR